MGVPNEKQFILVIDDSYQIRYLLKLRLEHRGFYIIEADNAEKGASLAKQYSPNLIILDFDMPCMNGLDTANLLKTDPNTKTIPIVLLSSMPFNDMLTSIGVQVEYPEELREVLLD